MRRKWHNEIEKATVKVDLCKFANNDKKKIVEQIIHETSNCLEENNEVLCNQGVIGVENIFQGITVNQ